jgi:peptidyl-prolyl cis-trans isomerase C
MRKRLSCLLMTAVLIGVAMTSMAQDTSEEVAVIVNGSEIYTWELALLLPQIQTEMAAQGLDPKGDVVIRSVLQRAVDSRLLAQEAVRRGIEPNTARLNEKMAKMAEGAGGRANLEAELIKSGITYSQLLSTVRQADLVQTLVETEVAAANLVTPEEISAYYNENLARFKNQDKIHTRHILFVTKPGDDSARKQAAREKAVAAHARAVAGEDFAALAIELSDGPNASKGGDLGFTARGQMVEEFDEAVWALESGEISDVVETYLGYHVIKVEEISIGSTVPLDEARPAVEDLLRQQRIGVVISGLVTELMKTADIREPEL